MSLTKYWLKHYLNRVVGLCALCANTGTIRIENAVSPAGIRLKPQDHFCICPNGRAMRKHSTKP